MTAISSPPAPTYSPRGWDLSELLPDASEEVLTDHLRRQSEAVEAFEHRRQALDPAMDSGLLLEILHEYERIVEGDWVLSAYATLWFYAETQSQKALAFKNRVQQQLTTLANRTLFFDLWWRSLSDDEAAPLLPDAAHHPDERHFLLERRQLAPYSLEERTEQVINVKDSNGMEGLLTVYSMLTNRMEFQLPVDSEDADRETVSLTRDELMRHAYSPDPERRQAAYRELYRVYGDESSILGEIYACRVRDWHEENVELRGMSSPIAVRNLANDVPDEAVETLLEVCREQRSLFQRYFRLKAGWLGLDRLRRYDLYAPLASSDAEIPYEEAVAEVLDTFGRFHPTVEQMARRVFDENHIDSEVRKGKRGGALCSTVGPQLTPWVLVNYTGRLRDVATLAHELGHAVHSMLARDHSILTQQASLPLAETASVFGEILVTERLLEREDDPLARREILAKTVDDIYATVLRQAYFVLFERQAHASVVAGGSIDDLHDLYLANLAEQFGDAVEVPDEFRYEWVSIPHIYRTPFYCYAYSFGQLLVLALYQRYKTQGEAFKPGYLRLLAHGGSARPETILAEAGIDMSDAEFWRGGFRVLEGLIDELEGLDL